MNSNRRNFLLGTPLAFLAMQELGDSPLDAAPALSAADAEAVRFWLNGMGVPSSMLQSAGADAIRGAQSRGPDGGPGLGEFKREPVFLHWDERRRRLTDVSEIEQGMMSPE